MVERVQIQQKGGEFATVNGRMLIGNNFGKLNGWVEATAVVVAVGE